MSDGGPLACEDREAGQEVVRPLKPHARVDVLRQQEEPTSCEEVPVIKVRPDLHKLENDRHSFF